MDTVKFLDNPQKILHEGWQVLVEQLGLQQAAHFVVLVERGDGDTIETILNYWKDKEIEDIHHYVTAWKTKKQLLI